jgi:hypothetical protein
MMAQAGMDPEAFSRVPDASGAAGHTTPDSRSIGPATWKR